MKPSPIILALAVIAGGTTWYLFIPSKTIPIRATRPAETKNTSFRSPAVAKEVAAIKLPKVTARNTASEVLSTWWVKFSPEEAVRYSAELIEQSAAYEDYQVYYLGRPVQHLTIRRYLNGSQEITPLEPFNVIDDKNLLDQDLVAQKVRAKNSEITDISLEETAWGLGDNRSLYPAYRFRVTMKGSETKQAWTANAKTGEITSINTYSRH